MAITVTDLCKDYGPQEVVKGISFHIDAGEIVGFLGPNGAGKSTTMKILTGFVQPAAGTVIINGYDISTHRKEVQRCIGYLPEHNPQYEEMYVREFLSFTAEVYQVEKEHIENVIALTGLTSEAHKKTGQLSKGYRQRVGLAAALLHDPEVLILDEPTTGLDPNQLVAMRDLIRSLGKKKTILLSTHILQEVEAVCNRVLIMNKGELVADTSMAALCDEGIQIIEVAFEGRAKTAVFKRLPHLKSMRNLSGAVYELTFTTPKDMRTAVFDLAHDNGLKIRQLNQRHSHLEQLFRRVTKN